MDFVNFVMALSPILVVLVGILGFKQSAKRVSPIALVWTLILAFTYFNVTGASFADNVKTLDPLVWKGIKEGLKIVLMVFGALGTCCARPAPLTTSSPPSPASAMTAACSSSSSA